jgi:circadian clock protein KaiB
MDQENKKSETTETYESALSAAKDQQFILKLYVAGSTSRSLAAIANIRQFCETHLQNRYRLDVVDIYQQPSAVRENQIVAAPTLIKQLPAPLRRMIGDFSKEERIFVGLDLSDGGDRK